MHSEFLWLMWFINSEFFNEFSKNGLLDDNSKSLLSTVVLVLTSDILSPRGQYPLRIAIIVLLDNSESTCTTLLTRLLETL